MRIWNKAVWQMTDEGMHLLECECIDYEGEVAQCKGGGNPPPPPDPGRTAQAQTESNQQSAAFNAALNRFNTYTPWGSQEFSTSGTDPNTGAPIYQQDINLSPEQQGLYEQQVGQQGQIGDISSDMLANFPYGEQMDVSGLPQLQGNIDSSGFPGLEGNYQNFAPQMNVNAGNLPELPNDLSGFRDRAEGALYDRNTAYLDKDFDRQSDRLQTRLANQGVVEGSEAYGGAMDDFNRNREMSYRQARNESIIGGGDEASRMFDIASRGRGQLYGEALSGGSFANLASDQATRQGADSAGFANRARNQAFGESLAGSGLSNEARRQGLSESFARRNQPLNEYSALRSLNQVNMPQFSPAAQAGSAPADVTGAMNTQYAGQMNAYNARMQSRNNLMSGLFGLGSAGILASDEELKENIVQVGELADETNIYMYNYKGDDVPQIGVIAQEIEQTNPSAVIEGMDGYKRVDYAKVLASALQA